MGENHCERHALFCLISGIAEHESLVPSSNVIIITINMYTLSNVGTLLLQSNQNIAGLVVKACNKRKESLLQVPLHHLTDMDEQRETN